MKRVPDFVLWLWRKTAVHSAIALSILVLSSSLAQAQWRTFWTFDSGNVGPHPNGQFALELFKSVYAQPGYWDANRNFEFINSSDYQISVKIFQNPVCIDDDDRMLSTLNSACANKRTKFLPYNKNSATTAFYQDDNRLEFGKSYTFHFDVTVNDSGHGLPRWPVDGSTFSLFHELYQCDKCGGPAVALHIRDYGTAANPDPKWIILYRFGDASQPPLTQSTGPLIDFELGKTYTVSVGYKAGIGDGHVSYGITAPGLSYGYWSLSGTTIMTHNELGQEFPVGVTVGKSPEPTFGVYGGGDWKATLAVVEGEIDMTVRATYDNMEFKVLE